MRVQTVTAINPAKRNTGNSRSARDLTSFGISSTSAAEIDAQKAGEAIKTTFLSNVSFKGHTEEFSQHKFGTSGVIHYGLPSAPVSVSGWGTSGEPKDSIIRRSSNWHPNSSLEETRNYYTTQRVYFADPEETVNAQTKIDHDYIVYDNMPKYPRYQDVKDKYYLNDNHTDIHQYVRTLKSYYDRLGEADKIELERLLKRRNAAEEQLRNSEEYREKYSDQFIDTPYGRAENPEKRAADYYYGENVARRDDINQKIGYYVDRLNDSKHRQDTADEMMEILNQSGQLFLDRDYLNSRLRDLDFYLSVYDREAAYAKEDNKTKIPLLNDKKNDLKATEIWRDKKQKEFDTAKQTRGYVYNEEEKLDEIKSLNDEIIELEKDIKTLSNKIERNNKDIKRAEDFHKTEPEVRLDLKQKLMRVQDDLGINFSKIEEFYRTKLEDWQIK